MSDTIKTTLELGGITMKYGDYGECIKLSRTTGCCVTYNLNYEECLLVSSDFSKPFYIECTDDPSKLHKFCEMKYLGLVDNPHYKGVRDMLREMVKKFDGRVVVGAEDSLVLITKTQPIRLGCQKGAGHVLRDVLVLFGDRSSSNYVSFWKIDASRIPEKMIWNPEYDNDVKAVCEQIKDMEP